MADGCRLVITVPGGPMSAFDKHIGHRKHWRPQEIEDLMRKAGFTPERVTGAGFPFFNLYRCVVIMRGEKLIQDVSSGSGASSLSARIAAAVFPVDSKAPQVLYRSGWQIVRPTRVINQSRNDKMKLSPIAKQRATVPQFFLLLDSGSRIGVRPRLYQRSDSGSRTAKSLHGLKEPRCPPMLWTHGPVPVVWIYRYPKPSFCLAGSCSRFQPIL
jgi:hypothetical protein